MVSLLIEWAKYRERLERQGWEYVGHRTKPVALKFVKLLQKRGWMVKIADTGMVTAGKRIPIYGVFRKKRSQKKKR